MESKLDRMVLTMLNGLDLDKYAPLFEKHDINLDLFLSLNEDDFRTIGIDDKEEIDTIMKYNKKFRKNEKWPDPKSLQFEEVTEILKNTEEYLFAANVACSFVQNSMQKGKPLDIIVHNDTAASSAVAMICEKVQSENEALIDEINSFMKDVRKKPDKDKPTSAKKISLSVIIAGALMSIVIAGVLFLRKQSME